MGLRRLSGALANFGHDYAANTIGSILKRHGTEPAPECERKTNWKEFVLGYFAHMVPTSSDPSPAASRLSLSLREGHGKTSL